MAEDIALTRRRRMLAFLVEQGGSGTLADANGFSEGRLLAAHQAFSAIMEGIVDGGFATWDGTTFVVTDAGRAEAALAPQPRRRKSAPARATETPAVQEVASAGGEEHRHDPAQVGTHDHGQNHAHGGAHDHGQNHAHGGAHDHGHAHAHGGGNAAAEPTSRLDSGPRPQARPPRAGLRARILGALRGLLRGR